MKWIIGLLLIVLFSCGKEKKQATDLNDTLKTVDTITVVEPMVADTIVSKKYANERFREVTVEKTADQQYRIRGEGQLFEATLSWIVEDGHNELKKGFETTDAGAPEWGKFDFTVAVQKAEANSTLILVLFEASAKDGSRQHELAVPLG